MEQCFHARVHVLNCYLDMLYKLQKRMRESVGSTLAESFGPVEVFSIGITLVDVHLCYTYIPRFK